MDTNTVIVIAIFALVIVVASFAFRKRLKGAIKGPLGTSMEVDASNESPAPASAPKAVVKGSTSRAGGILAENKVGGDSLVEDSEAEKDIVASTATPGENEHPKA